MKNSFRILLFVLISLFLMSCQIVNILSGEKNDVSTPSLIKATGVPETEILSASQQPTQDAPLSGTQAKTDLDPCSLIKPAEAEAIMGESASPAKNIYGSCTFSNSKDSLYMVSVSAAQNKQSEGVLQGQVMLLGFAGVTLDEAVMEKIKKFSAALDYNGLFTELVAAAGDKTSPHAQLIEDRKYDLVYWVWINVPPRRQGAIVVARGQTLVSINLVVADTQSEEKMLAASRSLVEKIFERVPANFDLILPTPESTQTDPSDNPTLSITPTLGSSPTLTMTPTLAGSPTLSGTTTLAASPTLPITPTLVSSPTPVEDSSPSKIPTATLAGNPDPADSPTPVPSPTLAK